MEIQMPKTIIFKDDTDPEGVRSVFLTLDASDTAVLERLRHLKEGAVPASFIKSMPRSERNIISASIDGDVVHVVVQNHKRPSSYTRSFSIPRKVLFGW